MAIFILQSDWWNSILAFLPLCKGWFVFCLVCLANVPDLVCWVRSLYREQLVVYRGLLSPKFCEMLLTTNKVAKKNISPTKNIPMKMLKT